MSMVRLPEESSLEFRRRVLDPVSKSFCAAKWLNATIWLGSGQTASCHHPLPHAISPEEVKVNPRALHNTRHKKRMRELMLKGERPAECEYCWKIEDLGPESISDRVSKSDFYPAESIARVAGADPRTDSRLESLEIAFDRKCNFACSYCNAGFSTRWAQDIKREGPYRALTSDGGGAYAHDGSWADEHVGDDENNPYLEAFWKWWPELKDTLLQLNVTGGEPLMSNAFWKFLDEVEAKGCREDMLLSLNSNLGSPAEKVRRLLEKTARVKKFGLYTSCEAVGPIAEYIRDGMDFELYRENCVRVLESGRLQRFQMMCTISAPALYGMTDFMDLMLEWKARFGKYYPAFSLTILRFPSFMSPSVLPTDLKQERRDHLAKWLARNESNPLLAFVEIDNLKRLIAYLDEVEEPHSRSSGLEARRRDFKSFFTQYDRRRGKNFAATFPKILVDWYEGLELPVEESGKTWGAGNAAEGFHGA